MRKDTLAILLVGVGLLTACNNTDIGIIGGADGPTSIIIGEQTDLPTETQLENHSFLGTVLEETTAYMIVEPNEDEAERKLSDKIRINYGADHIDYLYGVGRKVIVNYNGFIKETYPAQITTNNIDCDGYDEFEINVKVADKKKIEKILNNQEIDKYNSDYSLYYAGLEEVNVKVGKKEMSLEKALRDGYITLDGLVSKCNKDVEENEKMYDDFEEKQSVKLALPISMMYKDGGTMEYQYENYTIIKCHTLEGNRDVYICSPGTQLKDLNI